MTWGISGPVFLGFYAAVFTVLLIGAERDRRRIGLGSSGEMLSSRWTAVGATRFDLDEVALLTGGRPLVRTTALVALQENGSVLVEGAILRATDVVPTHASRVQSGLYQRLRESGAVTLHRARLLAAQEPAVGEVEADLARRGWVPDPVGARAARRWTFVFVLLAVLGIVRLVAGAAAGRPVGYLLVLVALTVGAMAWTSHIPRLTPAGREHLRQLRDRGQAYRSGGLPGERAVAVALFGAGVLWSADAVLAQTLGMQKTSAWATASGGSGSGGYYGGGDSGGSGGGDSGGGHSGGGHSGGGDSGGGSCGGGCGGGGCGG